MKGWRLVVAPSGARVDVWRDTPEYGETLVGSLFLSDPDIAELQEIFSDRPA
jgi:hypothetical protein